MTLPHFFYTFKHVHICNWQDRRNHLLYLKLFSTTFWSNNCLRWNDSYPSELKKEYIKSDPIAFITLWVLINLCFYFLPQKIPVRVLVVRRLVKNIRRIEGGIFSASSMRRTTSSDLQLTTILLERRSRSSPNSSSIFIHNRSNHFQNW